MKLPKRDKAKRPSALESALAEKAFSESPLRAIINAESACAADLAQIAGRPIAGFVHPDNRER